MTMPPPLTEREWQGLIVDAARWRGWYVVHFPNALYNPPGWPDLICFRDGQTLFLECKTEKGRLGPRQQETILALREHGHTVYIARPSEEEEVMQLLETGL